MQHSTRNTFYSLPHLSAFFTVLTILRLVEYFTVHFIGEEAQQIPQLILGMVYDFALATTLILICALLDLVFVLFKKPVHFFSFIVPLIWVLIQAGLVVFFQKANLPLDESVYLFSAKELETIANLKQNANIASILLLVFCVAFFGFLVFLFSKVRWRKFHQWFVYLFLFWSIFTRFYYFDSPSRTASVFTNNRLSYFIGRSMLFFKEQRALLFEENQTLASFEEINTHLFSEIQKDNPYPIYHEFQSGSNLEPYFMDFKEKPNVVYLIVESLSSDFIGEYATQTGNCMPFLDSLKDQSLYFPNVFATCQRTFNVLPSTLASIPNSTDGNFTTNQDFVPHLSLFHLLGEDYFSRFYCGVDLTYGHMGDYMKNIGCEHIVSDWDKKYQQKFSKRPNFWGYPDGFVYRKSWEDLEKLEQKKPRMDVFLSISSHDPYSYPNDEKYAAKIRKKQASYSIPKEVKKQLFKDEYIMGSYLYTDDALKAYFAEAKHDERYNETIFVIFGDHGCPFYARNEASKFLVPLIIYSPMLKHAKKVDAIQTHQDIAPALYRLLVSKKQLKPSKKVHFVGTDLDLTPGFHSSKKIPILSYNGANESMLWGEFLYLKGKTFRLNPHIKLTPVSDKRITKKIEKQLVQYEQFSRYIFKNQMLLPKEEFKRYNGGKLIASGIAYDLFHSELRLLKTKNTSDIKIPLTDDIHVPKKTKYLKVHSDIQWHLADETEIDSIPRVVLEIEDSRFGKKHIVTKLFMRPRYKGRFVSKKANSLKVYFEVDLRNFPALSKHNKVRMYLQQKQQHKWKIEAAKSFFYTDKK